MTVDEARRMVHAGGYESKVDTEDPGHVRIYTTDRILVGMILIRDDRMTYAELNGRVYATWPHDSEWAHRETQRRFELAIAQGPRP